MVDDRIFMVMGEDENGDMHLFASGSLERAEVVLAQFQEDLFDAKGNWMALANETAAFGRRS